MIMSGRRHEVDMYYVTMNHDYKLSLEGKIVSAQNTEQVKTNCTPNYNI
jgi:hypothetical protein